VEITPDQLGSIEKVIDSAFERMMGFPLNPESPAAFADDIKKNLHPMIDEAKEASELWNKLDGLNTTHFGNGERFVVYYKDVVRYLPPFDWWYVWILEEGRWARDERGIIHEFGKRVVRKIYDEASKASGDERRKILAKWAIACETPGSVNQMLEIARSTPSIVIMPDVLDPDSSLINLRNGYYSFVDHHIHPHEKRRFFSMMIPVMYDGAASCPNWKAFLNRMFQNNTDREKIIEFIQRALGYTLTGDTSERAIFLMHGLGANGKTVFIRVLEALFGDYGAAVSSATFTTAMATNVRNDLARLRGKRFVWASENSSETVLDEEMIKRISGGDTITCRFLFKEEFEYRPNFKIWWVFNHKPKIKDATDSIWDRIYLIPCEERIPVAEQDKHLVDKLIKELPGIFNWATDGYFKYKRDGGLLAPSSVKEATKEYRRDEDLLADFLDETFQEAQATLDGLGADSRMPFRRIWDLWSQWCVVNNEKIRTKTWLGRQLDSRYKKYHTMKERGYLGLIVKQMASS
jgi:putative DNA primase/helicase